jgi:hypothetical protein
MRSRMLSSYESGPRFFRMRGRGRGDGELIRRRIDSISSQQLRIDCMHSSSCGEGLPSFFFIIKLRAIKAGSAASLKGRYASEMQEKDEADSGVGVCGAELPPAAPI